MCRGLSDEVRWATIVDVLVHPDYRGKGIGKEIVDRLLKKEEMQVRTIYLATPDMNKFYENLGFKVVEDECYYMVKVNFDRDEDYSIGSCKK